MRISAFIYFVVYAFASLLAVSASASPGCPRPPIGAEVATPPNLYSKNGALDVTLNYYTQLDDANRTLFCFVTDDGLQSPTLHVHPGDTLNITLKNRLPAAPGAEPELAVAPDVWGCGSLDMNNASVNIHFHGANVRPNCHSDEVIHTLVNAGDTFTYHVTFPTDEPPGLYWYHPHVHGISDFALRGGATGALIVEGIEKFEPKLRGLPERVLIIRDQRLKRVTTRASSRVVTPSWDISLNYVPIEAPGLIPAKMSVAPGRKEFWRVVNTSADTIVDVDLVYDGVAQPLQIVALDGVPVGSHDGEHSGSSFKVTHVLLPPAGRAEFIVTTPPESVKRAIFETQAIDTGPSGDTDTQRTLAVLIPIARAPTEALRRLPDSAGDPGPQRFDGIDSQLVARRRKLYLSEVALTGISDGPTDFYITLAGEQPKLFTPTEPPAITTTQGTVEEWTIENRTQEVHDFHIHQIHFQLREINHVPVPPHERQFYDTFQVPYWSGSGPYPSITVAMDFRGDIVGDFVYHCHILDHEDNGMMAKIRVLPSAN